VVAVILPPPRVHFRSNSVLGISVLAMPVRLSHTIIVCFWLATMSWLAVVKILPGLRQGERPDYYSALEKDSPRSEPDCWRIIWRDRTIGFAATDIEHFSDGQVVMRSVVQFDELPLQSMSNELFGVLAVVIKPLFQGFGDSGMELLIASQMQFDADRRFSGFTTRVDAAQQEDFLVLSGNTDANGTLTFEARMFDGTANGSGTQILKREIKLPPGALVGDAFAPRPELKNLKVGQSWTVPVYRPFPPGSRPQIIQATVKRLETIPWDGHEVETMLVLYRSEAGSSINIASDPIGKEWVRSDGTVVRQEVIFSGLKFQFDRLPVGHNDPRIELLDRAKHPRLWKSAHTTSDSSSTEKRATPPSLR
jgi:hypothetical protein